MTKARQEQVSLESTAFYHCYVRCVRRAYLCGEDRETGENFEHRKQWIVSRLRYLSYIYAIDICAYAVMSNHYHVVLHVDAVRAASWPDAEVAERWGQLYNGNMLVNRWLENPDACDGAALDKVREIIGQWRERLCDISWFMRGINETIARMANAEDRCKGRFWEGRFRSQALLDEAALLSCMAYVDLNPVRAGVAEDVPGSDFTSVQQRLIDYVLERKNGSNRAPDLAQKASQQQTLKEESGVQDQAAAPLMPLCGSSHEDIHMALPFTREDYFDLVDQTGRAIRGDKRGFIASSVPSIVGRLGINPNEWLAHVQNFGKRYAGCAGSADRIRSYAERFDRSWGKGTACSTTVYRVAEAA